MFAAVAAVALATMAAYSAFAYYTLLGPGAKDIDEQLRADALIVLRALPDDIDQPRREAAGQLRSTESTPPRELPVRFQVWSRDGRLLLRSTDAPRDAMDPSMQPGARDVRTDGAVWRVVSVTDLEQRVIVQYGFARADMVAVMRESMRTTVVIVGAIFVLQLLALLAVVQWSLRPLRDLRDALDRRQVDGGESLALHGLPSEIRPVVGSFNGLLARIDDMRAAERRFLAEAAHELRTPLAAMRLQAQAIAAAVDARQRDASVAELLSGIDRTTRIAGQMLDLAQVEARHREGIKPVRCDLDALILAALESVVVPGQRGGAPVEVVSSGLTVRLQPALFELALRNLVHNAFRHAGDAAGVRMVVAAEAKRLRVAVIDSGPGVPDGVATPTRALAGGHRGLGLDIVRRVCAAHGGELLLARMPEVPRVHPTMVFPDAVVDANASMPA